MGTTYNPTIVRDGLALCLDAANVRSYPGTGTTWYDLSGNGNHATLTGTPTFSNGTVNWNGTSQYATVTTDGTGSLDFRYEQTVSIWMYHTFTSGRRNPWDQAYGGYGTWTHESGSNINGYWGDNGGNGTPYTSLNSGNTDRGIWNCMTRTRNTTGTYWYKNGIQIQSSGNSYADLPVTTANIRIANGYAGYWQGQMGPIMVYNRELTSDEVLRNFNCHRGRYGL